MTTNQIRYTINAVLGLVCAIAGLIALSALAGSRPGGAADSSPPYVPEVAVTEIQPRTTSVPVVGFGTVRPKNQINIIPQVNGKLTYVNESLAPGKVVPQGDLLFEIDPAPYLARVAQAEADERSLEATINRLNQEMTNLDSRIANAKEILAIDERDYTTSKSLFEVDKVGTQRDVDLVRQRLLRQSDVVDKLENQRAVAPHVIHETQAQLDASTARVQQAKLDLKNTKIICPFQARVESVGAYVSQVVTAHLSIATLTDMSAFEVSVGVDPQELRWLIDSAQPSALEQGSTGTLPVNVSWSIPGATFHWRGFVTRFERVDETTRTARMVVEIREADMVASSEAQAMTQMLAIGMHTRTELPGRRLDDALLVPRHAIHGGRWVYVAEQLHGQGGKTFRLGKRLVSRLRNIGDEVLVDYQGRSDLQACELQPGDRVVVSPLPQPVVGMRIKVREQQVTDASDRFDARLNAKTVSAAQTMPQLLATIGTMTTVSGAVVPPAWTLGASRSTLPTDSR